jgi:hypothetical protein
MLRGTIEVALEGRDDVAPRRPDAKPAVWGDEHLVLSELFTSAKEHRDRIEGRLQDRAAAPTNK